MRATFKALGILVFALSMTVTSRANVVAPNILPKALEGIGIDQRLNEQVPLDIPFVDEAGRSVLLSEYLGKRPAVLVLAYYECPRLCTMVLNGVGEALSKTGLRLGKDYQVITVSINPRDTSALAAAKKANYVKRYAALGGGGEAWHFLTGKQESITRLASAVGFRYKYDAKTEEFLHASGIMVLTPKGLISHYFYGIQYPFRDLRLALVEASNGKIGTRADQVLLFCCSIDLTTGKYTASIFRIVQFLGIGFALILGGLIVILYRYDPKT